METKILTLRYAPELGVIDDAPLRALAEDHENLAGMPNILAIRLDLNI